MLKMPIGVPLTIMSKTSWTIPQLDKNTSQGTNNALFTGSGEAVSDLSPQTKNETTGNNSADSSIMIPLVPRVVNNALKARDNEKMVRTVQHKMAGIFIPLEKLSRKKRQSQNRTPQTNDSLRNRVLLLTNQGSNGTLNRRLDGRVIMLLKQPNETSQWSNATMRIKSRDSLYDVVQANDRNNQLREVTRSLPAIQRISDLNNIELPLTPSEFTHINNSSMNASRNMSNNQTNPVLRVNGLQSANLVSGRTNTRNMTSANRIEGASRQNFRTQNRQSSRQQSNRQPNRQLVSLRHSQNNGRPGTRRPQNRMNLNRSVQSNTQPSRQATTNSRGRTRRPVQPRLTVQQPVSSRRISSQPSSSRTSSRRRITRPLVRAISSQALRQQSQRNRASQPRQRTNTIRRQPRRQIVRRRRPSPPDPFTRRFAAGFQRGSNLLHQPPLDFTGFDGTVRENAGFNGLPPNEIRLPMPTLTQTPRLFGGLTLPGFGFGPTII